MEYVYKYVEQNKTKYVGITNNLSKRYYQHTKDKLNEMRNPDVWYFPIKYRADAEMLETYLINYYGTKKYYNIAKTAKGDFSFLDICDRLPWVLYDGTIDETLEPFSVTGLIGKKEIETVYRKETIYVDKSSDDAIISRYYEEDSKLNHYIDCEIDCEKKVVSLLNKMLIENQYDPESNTYKTIKKGFLLHNKRLQGLKLLNRETQKFVFMQNRQRIEKLLRILNTIKILLEQHENHRYEDDWEEDYFDK